MYEHGRALSTIIYISKKLFVKLVFFFFYSSIDICKQISFMFEEEEENAQRQTRMYALEAISAIIFHI